MKSNFGIGTITISFFLDDINLLADRIAQLWTQPLETADKKKFRNAYSKRG